MRMVGIPLLLFSCLLPHPFSDMPAREISRQGCDAQNVLHGMKHFHAQEVKMSTTKHLAFQKLESVDMSLRDAIAPRQAESSANSGIISTNPIDKAAQFRHMSLFRSLEPGV